MKLATLRDSSRDGRLVVVSSNLTRYAAATHIAPTLQNALDNWENAESELLALFQRLEADETGTPFEESEAHSPLPRAYQWADGSAYVNHVELVRKARGVEMPASFFSNPLMYQGGSDNFLAPREPIQFPNADWGIDLEAEVAVIVDDVPMGASPEQARELIRLIMLVNDVTLRNLVPAELAKGFGFYQSKPSSAFSPVAVTPDELGSAWDGGKINLPMCVNVNGSPFGRAQCGEDMTFEFPELIAHAAKSRPLAAGSIIGSGTISNKLDGGPGKSISDGGAGYSCIAEIRTIETIESGKPVTPFLRFGDRVQIWMDDPDNRSIFGVIDQVVQKSGKI